LKLNKSDSIVDMKSDSKLSKEEYHLDVNQIQVDQLKAKLNNKISALNAFKTNLHDNKDSKVFFSYFKVIRNND
jgi:hypothetical protein